MKTIMTMLAVILAGGAAPASAASQEDAQYRRAFDTAVDKGLAYLAKAQLADGSFPGGAVKNSAVAALGVMAFLARGYSPGLPPYGDQIDRGIDFVLAAAAPNGFFGAGGGMYGHCIATLMLSEVSGMVEPERQKRVAVAQARALKLILDAQLVAKAEVYQGGWRYEPTSADSDLSHSGWALMALRSARNNGAPVPKAAIDNAVKFILRCRTADGGFAYQPGGGPGLARTGAGLLCLELSGRHRDQVTLGAGEFLLKHFQKGAGLTGEQYYYCLYYCAQGMFQLGAEQWEQFAPALYETLLKKQMEDGSWGPGGYGEQAGPCYRTAMAVLALSVSYCQLPIYQR